MVIEVQLASYLLEREGELIPKAVQIEENLDTTTYRSKFNVGQCISIYIPVHETL